MYNYVIVIIKKLEPAFKFNNIITEIPLIRNVLVLNNKYIYLRFKTRNIIDGDNEEICFDYRVSYDLVDRA